jgi:hypothetical protein
VLATIVHGYDSRLSRRDKNQAIEAPRIILALIGLQTWLPQAGAKLSEKFIFSLVPI